MVPSDPSKLCACARAHSFQRLRTDILLTDTLLHMGCSSSIAHISHFKKSAHTTKTSANTDYKKLEETLEVPSNQVKILVCEVSAYTKKKKNRHLSISHSKINFWRVHVRGVSLGGWYPQTMTKIFVKHLLI